MIYPVEHYTTKTFVPIGSLMVFGDIVYRVISVEPTMINNQKWFVYTVANNEHFE